jgi:3-hydroxy acid dehydrogenase / malonic semialdehyde reductase
MKLKDKIVLITGASSGIGRACAEKFAGAGSKLIICARRLSEIDKLAGNLKKEYGVEVLTFQVDVQKKAQVDAMVQNIPNAWKAVDILINNAGLALGLEKIHEGDITDWETMIDTNVKGLLYVTKQIVPIMASGGKPGHVINIGSIAGICAYPNGAVYCATKAAVKVLSDGLRMDVVDKPIRVTNIQPGLVETNFSVTRFHGDQARAKKVYDGIKPLTAEDIADIILYTASVPQHVQICEVTVTATHQASAQVVCKK